jgi:hypothetical protein
MRPFPSEEAFILQELVYHKAAENRRPGRSQEPKSGIAAEKRKRVPISAAIGPYSC